MAVAFYGRQDVAMQQTYKILVVDDEPDVEPLVLQRMRRQIRAGKYEFVFAQNGIEALDKLRDDHGIDMILSDINMPQMDGLTLLEQIGKLDPELRAVIISAYGDMKNIRTAMNRGAFDFVTKPIDFEDLAVTIERTLAHVAQWREALPLPGQAGCPAERVGRGQRYAAVYPPSTLPLKLHLPGLRQHGAGAQCGG